MNYVLLAKGISNYFLVCIWLNLDFFVLERLLEVGKRSLIQVNRLPVRYYERFTSCVERLLSDKNFVSFVGDGGEYLCIELC